MPPIYAKTHAKGGVLVLVQVVPRSSREAFGEVLGDRLKVYVNAPPVDGAANLALLNLLATRFNVARSSLEVVAGASSRKKTVHLRSLELDTFCERLRELKMV